MKRFLLTILIVTFNSALCFAHNVNPPASIEDFPLDKVSEHIYIVHGTQQLPSKKTRGFMNNPAAIITDNGVIIVDPGSTKQIARELINKVRNITQNPVIAIFNTHVHGDHWLGNHGIREEFPNVPIYAHDKMIKRIKAGEGQQWIEQLNKMTEGAAADTKMVIPNIGLKGGETVKLDNITLKIYHTGHAHTDHDIMIEVVNDKSLFFGDIVASQRVPHSDVPHDANFKGSITAIKSMLNNHIQLYIPGHGLSGGKEVPEASLRFLEILYNSVTRYFNEGMADFEMKDKVIKDLNEFRDWNNFNEIGRVINFTYQEVERDNF